MRIALIPARGGSRRIARKNVRPFAARPMIAWSIDCAHASGLFDIVAVSTDDDEIAEVAAAAGAAVPFRRPAELADDFSSTAAVMAHAAQALDPDCAAELCCIYPTAPLLRPEVLRDAAATFARGDLDFVFAAARFAFPPQRGVTIAANGRVNPWQPDAISARSQDLAPIFHDAGQFYWGSSRAWREQRAIFGERSAAIVLPPWEVCDIDTPEDWDYAERLFAIAQGGRDRA